MKKIATLLPLCLLFAGSYAQKTVEIPAPPPPPTYTTAADRQAGIQKRQMLEKNSLVTNLQFTNIGPTIMSGRVTDIEVDPAHAEHFYVAYASGGLWETNNNGQSFTPIFDHEDVLTIGDVAVNWNDHIIWVGTGEVNSSRSSYAGMGVYKSADNGATWEYCGLPESQHIGRIALHPSNPDIAYVAVLGHLYSANPERGIYKTTDGGKTWKQTLYVDENTGAVDVMMDPNVPDFLYATTWHRERRAWNFVEAGSGSAIYKSVDAGETWQKLSTASSGFPTGNYVGRIGIAVSPQHNNIVYAVVDNQDPKPEEIKEPDASKLNMDSLKGMTKDRFALIDNVMLDAFLKDNKFPEEYTALSIKAKVAAGEYLPTVLTDYLNDGGYVFNLPIKGCEVYRSDDGGTSWYKTHDGYLDGAFFTYGYYFATMKVSPKDDNKILVSAFNALLSEDGGKTFKSIDGDNVHPDHHAAWFDPRNDDHIIVGNDGGVNITYDNGKNWFLANNPPVGQFYSVTVDDAKPYNVYGGLQDNGVWTGPSNYQQSNNWLQNGKYPYQAVYGGDGMQVQVDTRDNSTVYTGYQYGYYARVNKNTGAEEASIRPAAKFGELPLRYNWQTPILLSQFNQDILYYGSDRFHRSMHNGESMETLSNDLTKGKKEGDVPFGTITTISESPMKFGLLYCGTDDGNIWVSKDGGYTWTGINVFIKKEMPPTKSKTPVAPVNMIPDDLWVSRVTAGKFAEGTVYVSLNGYRKDDFNPYLFMSTDYGATWTQIGTDLPDEPINVVKEDLKNKNIVYVGTDNGLYLSINGGKNFMAFNGGLPRVAVHDIALQPTANDIIIGTHGRSLYKANLDEVQTLDAIGASDISVFAIDTVTYNADQGKKYSPFYEPVSGAVTIAYYAKAAGITTIAIATEDGTVIKDMTDSTEAGLNYYTYDLSFDEAYKFAFEKFLDDQPVEGTREVSNLKAADDGHYYLVPGHYKVKLTTESLNAAETTLEVLKPE